MYFYHGFQASLDLVNKSLKFNFPSSFPPPIPVENINLQYPTLFLHSTYYPFPDLKLFPPLLMSHFGIASIYRQTHKFKIPHMRETL